MPDTNELDVLTSELADLAERIHSIRARITALADQPKPTADGPRLLSVTQAAKIAWVSRATMYRMIESGDVTTVTAGSTLKVPTVWVDEYVTGRVAVPIRGSK